MTRQRLDRGKLGENIALEYAQQQGYQIIQRNFRCKSGEIDLIAQDKHIVVFIEVRTKTSDAYGPAYNMVTYSKQQQVKRVALHYISERNLVNTQFRFDVIGITFEPNSDRYQLDHLQNAFQ